MPFTGGLLGCVSFVALIVHGISGQMPEELQDVPEECLEELVSCAIPVVLPYAFVDKSKYLEKARSISLAKHCRKIKRSFFCYREVIGKDQCASLNPQIVFGWKHVIDPMIDDARRFICRKEYKRFNQHYRCLLTEEVGYGIAQSCSSVQAASDINERLSQAVECVGNAVTANCGSDAGEVTKELIQMLGMRIISIARQQETTNDQPVFPEIAYTKHLAAIRTLLLRK